MLKLLWQILVHKYWVLKAGRKIGVPLWRAVLHDWSKFTPTEFFAYRDRFILGKDNPVAFARAYLHHIHHSQHHWQYHVALSRKGSRRSDGTCEGAALDMPEWAVKEMVADWYAATVAYSGLKPTMSNWTWLTVNFPTIPLSPATSRLAWELCEKVCA